MTDVGKKRSSQSLCHALPPQWRLLIVLVVIVVAAQVTVERWPAQAMLGVVIWIGHALARVPLVWIVKRLAMFIPMTVLLTISFPAVHGFRTGWDLMLTVLLRATVSFFALLWLARVLSFGEFLGVLGRWRVPNILIAMLSFMHRYLFLLWEELDRMRTAWQARSFGRGSVRFRWLSGSRLVGMLVIRGMSRADRVHAAMLARGWDGTVRRLDDVTDGADAPAVSP